MAKKTKVLMPHPYAIKSPEIDISKKIEVEVLGEHLNGLPSGICFIFFKYNSEFGGKKDNNSKSQSNDPYLDGSWYSFKGIGMFVNGILTDGPAFFVSGHGHYTGISFMKNGRPGDMS